VHRGAAAAKAFFSTRATMIACRHRAPLGHPSLSLWPTLGCKTQDPPSCYCKFCKYRCVNCDLLD
jgi:hypothetical protein